MTQEAMVAEARSTDVLITRLFDAPRELVYRAWTQREQLQHWYAPNGCKVTIEKLEERVGGKFHHYITTRDGYDCWCCGTFLELIEPERIVYSLVRSDPDGNVATPSDVGMHPDWPIETIVTVTLEEVDGKTLVTLHQTVSEELARTTGAYPSWLEMLERLADQVEAR